ncbi:unnamed protein product [Zymoseptoria tritici ST99CH_1A5]|uniref:MYND-type domain-containing protein n=1 Tax=Zymoseptoria tritici ST99CH_1A5 TaxID=1276529 RepID=A0A1Y6LYL8_ZYMTR|nr:unnamed protein product [Zymoseptoria tritici ST99CH_1A5]
MAGQVRCLLAQPLNNTAAPKTDDDFKKNFRADVFVVPMPSEGLAHEGNDYSHSSIAAQLGVPLKLLRMPVSYQGYTGFNFAANILLTDYDPTSSDFGTSPPGICGAALIVHSDGVDLTSGEIVKVMVDYINFFFLPKLERTLALAEGEDKEIAKKQIVGRLTKEAFHAYFEERRRLAIAEGKPLDGKPKSPVLLKYTKVAQSCGGCGALASPPVKLSMCAKCNFRHYCSKECQKEDWVTHKKACKVKL